ncbi:ubiquinone/menaquinone biosynthesis C-methylase UbiE [Orenia metallireducens]|uniref:Ubiquinone/menaquinone biosynthesis C-methylase UbiE n=1 Tax=Orenia metallireducens TaxID=1413210 RepID=A0A285I0K3_9FIRM|nr:class I SAM-dependent methyltransferase [Orenia metallireducens]PRX29271.1 ubiquinone/menaquinone biosynthesis C-methylase UbiE [Orenia metallireducens]SNY40586.1 Ubiquinone/menaquinone biosynthesis C-methylase UbiE [Orenia metallireducens]
MEKTEKTITAYNKNSEDYTNKFMNFPLYEKKIKEFISFLDCGNEVLDLGCGPGNVLKWLCSSGKEFSITGVDFSEKMLKIAEKNIPEGKFYCEDITNISFDESTFDVIILSFCIVHLDDNEMKVVLEKVSKYLRNKGKIYLSFMEGKEPGFETTSFSKEEIYYNYYEADKVRDLLANYDFEILKLSKQDYPEPDGSVTTDVFIFAEKNE